jgi:hypothetical protein
LGNTADALSKVFQFFFAGICTGLVFSRKQFERQRSVLQLGAARVLGVGERIN